MTEDQWLASTDPTAMLEFVKNKASDRKLRLFACSCCRHAWDLLSPEDQTIVAMVEDSVDGHFGLEAMRQQLRVTCPNSLFEPWDQSDWGAFRQRLREQDPDWLREDELSEIEQENGWFPEILFLPEPAHSARITAQAMPRWREMNVSIPPPTRAPNPHKRGDLQAWLAAWDEVYETFDNAVMAARETELVWQVAVLHDLFDNLYWPVPVDSAWSSWHGASVPRLARCIYEEGRFGELPILGDALEEAGCRSHDILSHCRRTGPHVRGCWVLDLLIGRV